MTRLARLLAAAWAAAVLAACTHAPVAHAPADDPALPDQWRTTIAPQAPLQREWWNSFGDPVLTGLVEDALANNLDVATAVARVREARAQEALARAQLSPSLAYSAGATRSRSLSALGQPSISTTVQPVFQAA